MATLTSTFYANTPKALHAGVNVIRVDWTSSASVSAGDIMFLAKLPNGARCYDFVWDHSTGAATCTLDLGLAKGTEVGGGVSISALASGVSQATQNRRTVRGIPPLVSTSDSDPDKYGILAAKVATVSSATSGIRICMQFAYTVDDHLT